MEGTYTEHAREARKLLGAQALRQLSRQRKPVRIVLKTALVWLQLLAGLGVAGTAPVHWIVVALPLIMVVQHTMVLWVHEGSHHTLFRSRRFNDLWTDFWFASPVGMSVATYRVAHMTHHRSLAGPDDMDRWVFAFDLRGSGAIRILLGALSGYFGMRVALRKYARGLISTENEKDVGLFPATLIMSAFWNLTFLGYFYICDRWYFYFVVWLFPVLTTMVLITVLHTLAEHQPDAYDGDPRTLADQPVARTTLPNPLEKWIFFQTNFNYHFEHHAFPTIPCHALPVAHAALRNAGFYVRYPELLQPSCLGRVFRLSRRQRELRNAIA